MCVCVCVCACCDGVVFTLFRGETFPTARIKEGMSKMCLMSRIRWVK